LTTGVLKDLEMAAQAYADAQAAVVDAQQALADRRADVPVARQRLADAIVAATRAGVRQRDIVDVTGYSRESVRRILRAAGVEAADD
jgi:CRP-like cAMP-binding protein